MKVGLDIHGVIDTYPAIFSSLSHNLIKNHHEIHIITGQQWDKVKSEIKKFNIAYTHHFSIVDYHLAHGTHMWQDEKKTWWMSKRIWLKAKGDYIRRAGIDIHFDDSVEYAKYCPDACTFILVPKRNFEVFKKMIFKS